MWITLFIKWVIFLKNNIIIYKLDNVVYKMHKAIFPNFQFKKCCILAFSILMCQKSNEIWDLHKDNNLQMPNAIDFFIYLFGNQNAIN